jgi:hypothetical protein
MSMRGLQGDKWTQEALEAFCKSKIRHLDRLIEELVPWKVLPIEFNPKALIFEAEAARRAYAHLLKGNLEKAIGWFRCLPNAIGKVNLYNNEFVVHLGLGWTHEMRSNKIVPVALSRDIGLDDPWAWVDVFEVPSVRELIKKGSHELKVSNTGRVTCMGWSEMAVVFEDEEDPRSYKTIKIGATHDCGVNFPANEPFHKVRCKDCRDSLEEYRERAWSAFRGPSKRRKGSSKGKAEKAIMNLLDLLD